MSMGTSSGRNLGIAGTAGVRALLRARAQPWPRAYSTTCATASDGNNGTKSSAQRSSTDTAQGSAQRSYKPSTPRARSAIFGDYPIRRTAVSPPEDPSWRLDPVAVMDNSPKRQCMISGNILPSAYLLRLKPARTQDTALALPHIQHPRFIPPRPGKSAYVALHRDAVALTQTMKGRHVGALRGILGHDARRVLVPPRLGEMVEHQLALRVRQEAEVLRGQVRGLRRGVEVLRALGGDEVRAVERGLAPGGAIAVLDLRGGSVSSGEEVVEEGERAAEASDGAAIALSDAQTLTTPDGLIPLWHVPTLIPSQAAAIASLVGEMVARRAGAEPPALVALQILPESEAFERRDMGIPLYIALSRMGLWFGRGWEERYFPLGGGEEGRGGWERGRDR